MYEVESSFSGGSQLADITESIHFNGANGVSTGNHNFGMTGSFPKTVTFWFKRMQTGVTHRPFGQDKTGGGSYTGFTILVEDSAISAYYANDAGGFYWLQSTAVLSGVTLGDWNHFIVEFTSDSIIKFTANNGSSSSGTYRGGAVTTVSVAGKTYLGAIPHYGYSQSKIYGLRAYDKILSVDEKLADYNKLLNGNELAIAGNATGTTWEDYTGNGFDTTLSGSFAISTDIPT